MRVLGSIVSEDGVMPDPDKVPVPRNVVDIRSFLGATGYFTSMFRRMLRRQRHYVRC